MDSIRVLHCSNIDISLDYEDVYLLMRQFGTVERIKLRATDEGKCFDGYVLFSSHENANSAHLSLNGHLVNDKVLRTKLFSTYNIVFSYSDFSPEEMDPDKLHTKQERKQPTAKWFVGEYVHGSNFMKAAEWVKWKIGNIPDKNLKRYGRSFLIEADDDTRAALLAHFKPPVNGNIKSVTPHRSFNIMKGIVHSKDLYEFSEDEILDRCPEVVYKVQKLKGSNNSILLFFSTQFLPEVINVCNSRLRVKKYRPSPKQCRQCFEYGHIVYFCPNKKRCSTCSEVYEEQHDCEFVNHCFHCSDTHSPVSKLCPRFRFEQEVVTVAEEEHISIGSAKRRVLGANRDPSSTYASVARQVKTKTSRPVTVVSLENNPPPRQVLNQCDIGKSVLQGACASTSKECSKDIVMEDMDTEELPDLNQASDSKNKSKEHSKSSTLGKNEKNKSSSNTAGHISKDGFVFPKEKKRRRPISPKSKDSGIPTKNSFSVLDDSPSRKKSAVQSKEKESSSSPVSCRPKDKNASQAIRRTDSSDSVNSCESAPVDVGATTSAKELVDANKKSTVSTDSLIPKLNKLDVQEEPSSSLKFSKSKSLPNTKAKRLSLNFKAPSSAASQSQTKNKLAGPEK